MPATLEIQIVGENTSAPAFAALKTDLGAVPGLAGAAAQSLGAIPAAAVATGDGLEGAAKAAGTYVDANGRLRDANDRFLPSAQAAGDAARAFGNEAEGAGHKLDAMGEIATGALRRLGEIGVDVLGKAAGAVVGFAQDSITAAGDFEQGMAAFENAVGQTMQGSGKSIGDFKQLFLSLGAELPVSTKEVEEAATAMAQGGIDPATIAAGALKDTINFAAAAMKGDLVGAAEISAKTMAAWTNINDDAATKTEFMAHAQNLMAQATTAASTTVDQLFLGLSNVGGTARLAGLSFDETTSALAQLTPGFSSSADAGTAFKTFLARLQPETAPAVRAMQELGLYSQETGSAFYDANGKFVGMAQAEELLHQATANLTDEQRQQALQTIFLSDAIRAAGMFATQGAAGYTALTDSIAKQTTVQEAAARNQATFNTSLENFKGSIESLQITIGSALLPILTQLFNSTLAPAVNVVTTFANALFGSKDALASLAPPVRLIVTGIQDLVGAFQSADEWSSSTEEAIATLAAQFVSLFTGVQVGSPAFWALQQPLQAVIQAISPLVSILQANLGPILIGIAAVLGGAVLAALASATAAFAAMAAPIVALVAVGALLYSAWSSDFGGIQTVVTAVLGAVWGVVSAVVGQITTFWTANGATILADASTIWGQLQSVIAVALQLIQTVVVDVLGFVGGFIAEHGALIQQVLAGAWQVLSGVIQGALALIRGIITVTLDVIQGDWAGAWQAIQDAAAGFVTALLHVFEGAVNILAGGAQTMIAAIIDVWHGFTGWADIGGGVIDGIISGIGKALSGLISAAANVAHEALTAAKSALGIASPSKLFQDEVGAMIPEGMAQGILAASPRALAALGDLMEKIAQAVSQASAALAAVDAYQGSTGSGLNGFLAGITEMAEAFSAAATALGGRILGTANRFADTIGKIVAPIATALAALAGLADVVVPAQANIDTFAVGITALLVALEATATQFDARGLKAGATFAESAGKLLGLVSPAIEALAALPDLVSPTQEQVNVFGDALARLTAELLNIATLFSTRGLDAASTFADAAGAALDLISPAVEAFKILPDLVSPSDAALIAFGDGIARLVAVLVSIAAEFSARGLDAASGFADAADGVIGLIKPAVEALKILPDLTVPGQAAINAFRAALASVLAALGDIASSWTQQAIDAAAAFAAGAGKAVGIVGGAVDGFVKLQDFKSIPQAAIDAFAAALDGVLTAIEYLSANWIQQFVDRAATFAEGAGKAVGIVGQAVDGFVKLQEFKSVPQAAIDAFATALDGVLTAIEYLSATWIADCVARAGTFAEGVGKIVAMIGQAVDGFVKLTGFKSSLGQNVIAEFTAALKELLSQLVAQVLPASVDVGSQIVAGIGRGLQAAAPSLAPILASAIDQAIGAAVRQLEDGSVTGSSAGRGSARGSGTTSITNATSHIYHISGYNANQASDLTTTVRQLQLIQDGA